MSENPYTAPQTFDAPPSLNSDAELIRKEHIKTEASIKSIGILYYLGSIGVILIAIGNVSGAGTSGSDANMGYVIAGILVILGVLQFFVGTAVRKLKPWSRIAVGIFSGIGLLGFPVGTLINAYILYLVFTKKGQMVFSEYYKEVIAATPHIKYKTPKIVWIILTIIIALIAVGIASIALSN